MSDKEMLGQQLGIVDFKKDSEIVTVYYETWWDKFLDNRTNNINAKKMIKEVNWKNDDEVDCVLQGLIDGSSDYSFFEAKNRLNGCEYNTGRLLSVCRVLPVKYRDYMATIVVDCLVDENECLFNEKDKDILEKILTFLKSEENKVEVIFSE
jgi:hypothetical protein